MCYRRWTGCLINECLAIKSTYVNTLQTSAFVKLNKLSKECVQKSKKKTGVRILLQLLCVVLRSTVQIYVF